MRILRMVIASALLLMTFTASAATVNLSPGTFKFTGDSYIDVTLPGETRAVGRITTISQGSTIIWNSGDGGNFISFLANGIAPVISPAAPLFNFVGTGGFVQFSVSCVPVVATGATCAWARASG